MSSGSAKKVLVFRIGSLGDTLVGVPALRAVRLRYPEARITLLCDKQIGRSWVLAADVLRGAGFVDEFLPYPFDPRRVGRFLQPFRMLRLLAELRRRRFDLFIYLVPSNRGGAAVERDRRYFAMARLPESVGYDGFPEFPSLRPPAGFEPVPQEADLLLARLRASGWNVPPPGRADLTLPDLGPEDAVDAWIAGAAPAGTGPWISVGIGGKKPVTRWPWDRFLAVGRALIARHDVWPIVFGGPEDAEVAGRLVAAWGRGAVAAGALTPHLGIAVMRRTAVYVGNDTGTMHMAVAAGIPCVAAFSSAHLAGWWFPYGSGHRVLRTAIACENCGLQVCVEKGLECLLSITPDRVVAACEEILARRPERAPARIRESLE